MTSSLRQIPLSKQADAVERMASNHAGHVDNLYSLVERKKRPVTELEIAQEWLPALQAAAKSMRWLAENEEKVKAAFAEAAE